MAKRLKKLPKIHVRPMDRSEKGTLGQVKKNGITHGAEYEVKDKGNGSPKRVTNITKGKKTARGRRIGQRADRRFRDNKDNTGARPTGPRGEYKKKHSRLPNKVVSLPVEKDNKPSNNTEPAKKQEPVKQHEPTKVVKNNEPNKQTQASDSTKKTEPSKKTSDGVVTKDKNVNRSSTKKGFVRRAWDSTKDRLTKSKTKDVAQKSSSDVVNAVDNVVNRLNRPDHIK